MDTVHLHGTCLPSISVCDNMTRITNYEVRETTPIVSKISEPVGRTARNLSTRVNARMVTPKFLGPLRKICPKCVPARIEAKIRPIEVYDMKFIALRNCRWAGELRGKIRFKIINKSQEAMKGNIMTWRWKPCPKEDYEYDLSPIEGTGDFIESITDSVLKTKDTKIGSFKETIKDKINMADSFTVDAEFVRSGFDKAFLQALKNEFGSKNIDLHQDVTLTISHKGVKGGTKTKQFKYRIDGNYTVSGGVDWVANRGSCI